MKIGDQMIDGPEAVARCDEQVCFIASGNELPCSGSGFQCAQTCGPDGDDFSSGGFRGPDGIDGFLRDGVPLGVHLVFRQIFASDRLESACAHMQGQISCPDAFLLKPVKQFLIEMQACSRRGDSARFTGEDGLVTGFVIGIGGPIDIGR